MPNKELASAQKLLTSVCFLYEQQLGSRADQAPNFNLFEILELEGKEVSTHSAFLAHLLDPTETHAQGNFFLRRFLAGVGYEELASFGGWIVQKEVPFESGRLDIVLQSASARAMVLIENKIDTQDHANQLKAYNEWLNTPQRRGFFHRERLLFYLTPQGDPARHAPKEIYKPISYSHDIREWLRGCNVKPSNVSDSIKSYLLTIDHLTTQTLMKDDLDDKILELIKTPVDRVAALRVARVGNYVKEQLLRDFWNRGEDYLNRKLADANLTYWSLDRTEGSPLQSHYEIAIIGKGAKNEEPHPRFSFFQYSTASLFRWELVVKFDGWRGKYEKIKMLPDARKLSNVMEGKFSMRKKRGWDGYRLFNTDDKKGIERTLEEEIIKSTEVDDFFDTGWQIFEGLEAYLRRLNNAV